MHFVTPFPALLLLLLFSGNVLPESELDNRDCCHLLTSLDNKQELG